MSGLIAKIAAPSHVGVGQFAMRYQSFTLVPTVRIELTTY
jgi:hypothetical protein